jgi:hypothetical protein
MKLPNGERAIVDTRKLLEYCLNSEHPRGRNKARVFASVGIQRANAEQLRTVILAAACGTDAQPGVANVQWTALHHRFRYAPPGKNRENPMHLDCEDWGRVAATDELLCTMNRTVCHDGN